MCSCGVNGDIPSLPTWTCAELNLISKVAIFRIIFIISLDYITYMFHIYISYFILHLYFLYLYYIYFIVFYSVQSKSNNCHENQFPSLIIKAFLIWLWSCIYHPVFKEVSQIGYSRHSYLTFPYKMMVLTLDTKKGIWFWSFIDRTYNMQERSPESLGPNQNVQTSVAYNFFTSIRKVINWLMHLWDSDSRQKSIMPTWIEWEHW